MNYKNSQYERQIKCGANHPAYFNNDPFNGVFYGKRRPFALLDGINNLYEPIRKDSLLFFAENEIKWWGGSSTPTNHTLSSQIACINHLFALRNDASAIKAIAEGLVNTTIDEVLPIPGDKTEGFVSFEVVSGEDLLNEGTPTRGANCTSIDALIHFRKGADNWILPIEWKYVEFYANDDKSENDSGITRLNRYGDLIRNSSLLKPVNSLKGSIYFFEPFYQLMRQTLWIEGIINGKDSLFKNIKKFRHIHVVPHENTALLNKKYFSDKLDMRTTWEGCLNDKSLYKLVTPQEFFKPICLNSELHSKYQELIEYLEARYW